MTSPQSLPCQTQPNQFLRYFVLFTNPINIYQTWLFQETYSKDCIKCKDYKVLLTEQKMKTIKYNKIKGGIMKLWGI